MDKDIVLWIMGVLIPIILGLIVVLWKKQEKHLDILGKKVDSIEDDYKKRLEKLDHQILDKFEKLRESINTNIEKLKESINTNIEKLKEKNIQEMNGMRKDIETHSLARIDNDITELKKIRDEAYHHALETTKTIGDLRETIAIYQSLFVRREECSVCRGEK